MGKVCRCLFPKVWGFIPERTTALLPITTPRAALLPFLCLLLLSI